MSGPDFLDANILVYAYDPADPAKQRIARDLLRAALTGAAVLSTQVLAEFASTLLHKMKPPARLERVAAAINAMHPIRLIAPDARIVVRAVEAHAKYKLHFYDCMIVAAAERANCARIWSEDMNAGQKYFGVGVENPFAPRRADPTAS
jgi:predicted nucleic acid-binding protein